MDKEEDFIGIDLFGEKVYKQSSLRDRFIEPPFSVLDSKGGNWQKQKRKWKELGIKSELGRDGTRGGTRSDLQRYRKQSQGPQIYDTDYSIFDPVLTQLIYRWFCPPGGTILDPFAGGSVRGVVANYLGYSYTGIDLNKKQIEDNYKQANKILPNNSPKWIVGDSEFKLDKLKGNNFDLIFTCPPYFDLEIYSQMIGELSNMDYIEFSAKYKIIIEKAYNLLKENRFAIFVVGHARDKKYGYYKDLSYLTKKHFFDMGSKLYNDIVFVEAYGTAALRTKQFVNSRKIIKVHQNVIIFYKGNTRNIKEIVKKWEI